VWVLGQYAFADEQSQIHVQIAKETRLAFDESP